MCRYLLENHRRSKAPTLIVTFDVSYDTTAQQLAQLKYIMLEYLKQHRRQWRAELVMLTDSVSPGPSGTLSLSFWITSHQSWMDGLDVWSAHSAFVMHTVAAMQALKIGYRMPTQPVAMVHDQVSSHAHDALASTLQRAPLSSQPLGEENHTDGLRHRPPSRAQ